MRETVRATYDELELNNRVSEVRVSYSESVSARENAALTAKKPGDQIKLANTHKTPVQSTDDGKKQCQCIHVFTSK